MIKRTLVFTTCVVALLVGVGTSTRLVQAQTGTFRVIGIGTVVVGNAVYHLDISNAPYGWKQLPAGSLTLPPVPASSLVQYESGSWAITDTGEGWGKVGGVWTDLGTIPSTAIQNSTWGQVKARYVH